MVVDRFPTGDAAYADLDAAGHDDVRDRVVPGVRRPRGAAPKVLLEPPGEARNDYLIWAELADRLGYGAPWPQTERAMVELALEGTGITYDALAASPDGVELPQPVQRSPQVRDR